jgi:hypothetical protein
MQSSEHIDQLITALCLARPALPRIAKNKRVTVKSDRGTYDFDYATLDVILDAVCPVLATQGLVVLCGGDAAPDGSVVVTTRLAHRSGQWIESMIHVGKPTRLQDLGSAITYGKRYGITAILGIQADDDDDGNQVDGNAVVPRQAPARRVTSTNGHAPAVAQPTTEDIDALFALAETCHEPKDAFGRQLRRIMGLNGEVLISKKFLKKSMTLTQFEVARAYYERLLRQQVENDVPDGRPPPTGKPHPLPEGEEPRPDDAVAKAALRQEAIGWGIREDEVAHVLTHHPFEKARNLLWQARRRVQRPAEV